MKVLLALDGTDCSKKALDSVAARSWGPREQFLILSVIEPFPEECDKKNSEEGEEYVEHMQVCCKELTEKAMQKLKERHPEATVESRVLEGAVVEQIIQCADSWSADMIVVGSMGHRDCRRFMHGSIAEAVLKQSPCSVEIIKERRGH